MGEDARSAKVKVLFYMGVLDGSKRSKRSVMNFNQEKKEHIGPS